MHSLISVNELPETYIDCSTSDQRNINLSILFPSLILKKDKWLICIQGYLQGVSISNGDYFGIQL